jgi:hypothetical protein
MAIPCSRRHGSGTCVLSAAAAAAAAATVAAAVHGPGVGWGEAGGCALPDTDIYKLQKRKLVFCRLQWRF